MKKLGSFLARFGIGLIVNLFAVVSLVLNLWEFVKEEFEEIFVLKTFFNLKKFEIIGKNDVVKEIGTIPKKYFISHILVNVIDENNKVYPFYDIIIDKVEYLLLGDRYNSFYGSYFMEKTPAISNFLKNFFEVYFMKEVVLSYENNIPEDLQKYKN